MKIDVARFQVGSMKCDKVLEFDSKESALAFIEDNQPESTDCANYYWQIMDNKPSRNMLPTSLRRPPYTVYALIPRNDKEIPKADNG